MNTTLSLSIFIASLHNGPMSDTVATIDGQIRRNTRSLLLHSVDIPEANFASAIPLASHSLYRTASEKRVYPWPWTGLRASCKGQIWDCYPERLASSGLNMKIDLILYFWSHIKLWLIVGCLCKIFRLCEVALLVVKSKREEGLAGLGESVEPVLFLFENWPDLRMREYHYFPCRLWLA